MGAIAGTLNSGFLGGIVGGVLAGVIAHWITGWKVPDLDARPDAGAGHPAAATSIVAGFADDRRPRQAARLA